MYGKKCMLENLRWDLYRTFLAVLEEGSLSAAARSLALTQPTVGRHISELESALGLSLFTRSQTGLLPTDAARALQDDAQAMRGIAAALERTGCGFSAGICGTVRISASEIVGVEVLPPILAGLQAAHPGLNFELVLSNKVQDLLRREVDIAVRMTAPKQEVLLATRVGDIPVALHAHQNYIERHGLPTSLADLESHVLIGYDQETPYLRAARAAYPFWSRANFALRCDSDLAQLALIRAGAGIGICQVALAQKNPHLVPVLSELFTLKLTTWVVMNEGLRNSTRFMTTFKGLVQGLRQYTQTPMNQVK